MTTIAPPHIRRDDRGAVWIDETNVKVIEVVLDRLAYGWSPEEIHFQHPDLSLAQIHAALAYYYDPSIRAGRGDCGAGGSGSAASTARSRLAAPGPTQGARPAPLSVRLYMDVHVPLAITEGLRLRSVDVVTAQQDGSRQLGDPELLDRAGALGRVLFTRDVDILAEATRRQREGGAFSGVVSENCRTLKFKTHSFDEA